MIYSINKIFSKKLIVFFIVFIFVFFLSFQTAEAKSYSYDLINVKINVNQDSTFDVEERQTFNYIGEYHVGWRSISLNKTDGISDIEVINGETGQELAYSSKRLDKLDPVSWKKFTYFKENGSQNIEWYYNLSDISYKWIIKYKVHGGIGFFPNYDKLYWNIFTDYEVPVKEAKVQVTLPVEVDYSNVAFNAYRTDTYQQYFIDKSPMPDKRSFLFEAKNFKPREAFTIQMSWPKGLVSQSAYWQDFLRIYLFYILAGLITIINFIFIIIHWYLREVRPVKNATIIPQYAPPENLRPAMVEVLLKEKVTDKGWSATVIDLAVRGYIRIKEDTVDWVDVAGRVFLVFILSGVILIIIWILTVNFSGDGAIAILIILAFLIRLLPIRKALFESIKNEKNISLLSRVKVFFEPLEDGKIKEFFVSKNYILNKTDNVDESILEDYEKSFLSIIFKNGNSFSTKEMKKSSNQERRIKLFDAMRLLERNLYKETNADTGAFEIGVEKEKTGFLFLLIIIILPIFFTIQLMIPVNSEIIFLFVLFSNILAFYIYLHYEAYLSPKGLILKEDWLGFKMYLETAERYRMQNLTPETFEKYLPYAIIFGIEKKWGKAFESLNIQNPSWYSGVYVGRGFHSGGFSQSGGFSPSGFSASFSSSFSSAFSSAGGAGGAGGGGGGGGAGGGGGGGGGGAG